MKKLLVSLTLAIAMLTTCLVGCGTALDDAGLAAEKANAAAIFTLDVNPGVRIYVNEDDSVIAVEATNEDGEEIVAELDVEGENYGEVVEEIIDKMDEKGYIEGEEGAVLISVEKKAIEISEKLNERIEKAFERRGKRAAVIEQELDGLDEEADKAIREIAERHRISEGKARLIEKLREEFPELSEEELAALKVNELGMILDEASEDVRGEFKKIDKAVEKDYVGKEQALAAALATVEGLELTAEDVTLCRVRVTRDDGKMVYEVEFVYEGMEYEITVDAETGDIIEAEIEEFVELDAKAIIDDFCRKHDIDPEKIKDQATNGIFDKDVKDDEESDEKPLTKGELLKGILEELGITEETLKKTDVRLYEAEGGAVYAVTVESGDGVYKLVVEAYSGAVLKAELNGVELELGVEVTE